jgi:hypothetical protein
MAELALDDVQRHALPASSSACAWRSWCGANRRLTPAPTATRRNSARTPAADHGRPRVGPSMRRTTAPRAARRAWPAMGAAAPSPSRPSRPRGAGLPCRVGPGLNSPGSRSCSARASASWMRSPARHSTTIIAAAGTRAGPRSCGASRR